MKILLNLWFFIALTLTNQECPKGQFFDVVERQCKPCISSCNLCTDDISCDLCDEGYIFSQGYCLKVRQLEDDMYDDDNYYDVSDEQVAEVLKAYSPQEISSTMNKILDELNMNGGEVNFGMSLLTLFKNLFIEQLDFSQWTKIFTNFSGLIFILISQKLIEKDPNDKISIEHYIKYFTAIENYLKLFANSGEDFDIDKFNFSTWAQSAVCRWTTLTKNLNWAGLAENYDFNDYDGDKMRNWLNMTDINWDNLTEFNWNYSNIAENVFVYELRNEWTKKKIKEIKDNYQWIYLDVEDNDLVDELNQFNFTLLEEELSNIQTIKEEYAIREQMGVGDANFANYLTGYQFSILHDNDLLTYEDLLIYEDELKEFAQFKPYFELSYLTFNLTDLVKRFNVTIGNQAELNFMNKLLQMDLSELENSYIVKDNLQDEYYMLKEQNLANFNLTLAAKKLNYTFDDLSEAELNAISTLLNKNDRQFFYSFDPCYEIKRYCQLN